MATTLALCLALCTAAAQTPHTWTLNADFDQGELFNVNHDIPDQLQLSGKASLFPFINVAASARGTVCRIDVNTGQVVGEYLTAPKGRGANPSRTTVDFEGNVWVGNRSEGIWFNNGSVTKIALVVGGTRCDSLGNPNPAGAYLKPPFAHCTAVDRNGDGLIHTSRGLADILPWTNALKADDNGGVSTAEDECIIIYKRGVPNGVRHLSIDASNNVWVAGQGTDFHCLTALGEKVDSIVGYRCGGYGGLVDRFNVLWSATSPFRYDINTRSASCISKTVYGITQDTSGSVWGSVYSSPSRMYKFRPDGAVDIGPVTLSSCNSASGVAVTPVDNNIWTACRSSNTVARIAPNGTQIGVVNLAPFKGSYPSGVAVDINGKVWVTCINSNNAMRIDPKIGIGMVDLVVDLGPGALPYNYSDMTGRVANMFNAMAGTWTVVHDDTLLDRPWGTVSWTEYLPKGASVTVEVRAANTQGGLGTHPYRRVYNGVPFCNVFGRYLQVRTVFARGPNQNASPILYDLTVKQREDLHPLLIGPRNGKILCDTVPIQLFDSSGYLARRWSTGDTARSITVNKPGRYTLTVWDPRMSCLMMDSVEIKAVASTPPRIRPSDRIAFCAGESALLTAEGAYVRYQWSTGHTTPAITARAGGTYTVLVTDSNGCTGTALCTVTRYPLPPLDIRSSGPLQFCAGDSAVLTVNGKYASIDWSNGAKGPRTVAKSSGKYFVTVTDSNGCLARDTVTIDVATRPAPVIAGATIACIGSTGTFTVFGQSGRTYEWKVDTSMAVVETGQATVRVVVRWKKTGSTIVTLLETDAATGCTGLASFPVTVQNSLRPAITALPGLTGCEGDSIRLDGGEGYASYLWSNGARTRSIDVRKAGRYALYVVDSGGCPGQSDTIDVAFKPRPVPVVNGPTAPCAGASATYTVSPAGAARIAWTASGGSILGGAGSDVLKLRWDSSGTQSLRVEMEVNGCTGVAEITIAVREPARAALALLGPAHLCEGDSTQLEAPGAMRTIRWSTGDTTRRIIVARAGSYWCAGSDAGGCAMQSDTIAIAVSAHPLPVVAGRSSICEGDSAVLDAGAFASYAWTLPGGGSSVARSVVARSPGVYLVTVQDSNGCAGSSPPFTLDVRPLPAPRIAGPASLCAGDSALLDAGAGYATYEWTLPSGMTRDTRSIVARVPGRYRVRVTDASGCAGDAPEHDLVVHPAPQAPLIARRCMTLSSTPAVRYQWLRDGVELMGEMRDAFLAPDTGVYAVRITDANGCSAVSAPFRLGDIRVPQATIAFPSLEAAPGERVRVEARLASSAWLEECGADRYTALLRLNRNILLPIEATPPGSVDGTDRLIAFSGPIAPGAGPVAAFDFLAALGDADRTDLHVENFTLSAPGARTTAVDGDFRLRICREGGDRLFDGAARFALRAARPNPFNVTTEIVYQLDEDAQVTLAVYDRLGRRVASLFDGEGRAGQHSIIFDASAIGSGVYTIALTSGTRMKVQSIVVMK